MPQTPSLSRHVSELADYTAWSKADDIKEMGLLSDEQAAEVDRIGHQLHHLPLPREDRLSLECMIVAAVDSGKFSL